MKKLLAIFAVVIVVAVMAGCVNNSYDGRCDEKIVLYPTTEVVTASLVIDSTTHVFNATVHIMGHLSDTMFVSFTDGSYHSWHNDTLIGDIDKKISNDWYEHYLHVQYHSNSVTKEDSVVVTCEFAQL